MQLPIFEELREPAIPPLSGTLLKWIGNKHRFASEIASYFPERFGCYYEPFLGSGAVLAALAPREAVASDTFEPLMEIWRELKDSPNNLKSWYDERCQRLEQEPKERVYESVKASYNRKPNGADLLYLCRTCYGGVVRFRKADGYMSTPCGIHAPIKPQSFARRVDEWHARIKGAELRIADFREALGEAKPGDMIYCDPPYSHSQTILYGAQGFSLMDLLSRIAACKRRGVFVALSIDGHKKSGTKACPLPIPEGLFEREIIIDCGRSMLRRFQLGGQTLEREVVADRLLLTY
jgi:DNA adenine methylase